jgi:hypothetical protein
MASSGTFAFSPQFNEILEESFERAGIDPVAVGQSHLQSAFRSLKFMLASEWSTIGIRQWMIERVQTPALTVNQTEFVLPLGGMDVIAAVLRRQSRDTEMNMISRNEYLTIVDKFWVGRPDRFYVDRSTINPKFVFWQASENNSDTIIYDLFKQNQDVGTMQQNIAVPQRAWDALCEGLAAYIARKFNRTVYPELLASYRGLDPVRIGGKLGALIMEDRERGDLETRAKFEPRTVRR